MAENIEVSVSENNGATDRLTTAVLQLAAAADRLEASAARGAAGTRGLGDAANNAQSGVGSLTRALGATQSAFGALQGYAGSFLALLSTQKIIEYGDAYTGLQNKLKLVTKDSEQMGKATQEIFRISQATRADLLGSATAYARISTSLKGMNRDTKDAGPILTTLNQAIALSGSTGAAAKSGLEQFQQALNRGVLRGQEFTSVAIGLPAVAAAIAEGLNKPVAALKGMADQGMLTSTKVLGALEKSAAAVQRAFAQSTPTVAQGFTVLQNAFTMWLGTANEGSGASNRLSNTLMFLGDNMNIVAPIAIGLAGVLTLGAVIIPATVAVYGMITALGGLAVSMIAATAAFLVTPFGMVFAAGVIIATTAIVAFWDKIKELTAGIPILGAAVQALTGFFGGNKDAADKTKTSHGSLSDKLKEVFAQFGTLTGGISTATKQHGEHGAAVNGVKKEYNQLGEELESWASVQARWAAADKARTDSLNDYFKSVGSATIGHRGLLESATSAAKGLDQVGSSARSAADGIVSYTNGMGNAVATTQQAGRVFYDASGNARSLSDSMFQATASASEQQDALDRLNASLGNYGALSQKAKDAQYNDKMALSSNNGYNYANSGSLKTDIDYSLGGKNSDITQSLQGRDGGSFSYVSNAYSIMANGKEIGNFQVGYAGYGQDGGNLASPRAYSDAQEQIQRAVDAYAKLHPDALTSELADVAAKANSSISGMQQNWYRRGFATGGDFMVGGSGGTDTQMVQFMASPDERVRVETPAQQRVSDRRAQGIPERETARSRMRTTINNIVIRTNDVDSFKRTRRQTLQDAAMRLQGA